jgi:hypothetical protein
LPTEVNRTYALPWVTRAAILSSDGCQAPDAVGTPLTRILSLETTGEAGGTNRPFSKAQPIFEDGMTNERHRE